MSRASIPIRDFSELYERELLRKGAAQVKRRVVQEGRRSLREYRATLPGRFKNRTSRLGKAFKLYARDSASEGLVLGIFTAWKPAKIYEEGGTILPSRGQYLVIPIHRSLFTATGRVKASVRSKRGDNYGAFDRRLFKRSFIVRRGKRLFVFRRSIQKGGPVELWFELVRSTRRRAILDFEGWMESQAIDRERLEAAVARDLRRTLRA